MPTRDPAPWMWAEACAMLERAERLHRQFFRPVPVHGARAVWEPPVDLYETPDEYWIFVALPGVRADEVALTIDGGVLIVSGMRVLPSEVRRAAIHRMELPQGRFERRIELPSGALRLNRRELADGCLVLTLRKLG